MAKVRKSGEGRKNTGGHHEEDDWLSAAAQEVFATDYTGYPGFFYLQKLFHSMVPLFCLAVLSCAIRGGYVFIRLTDHPGKDRWKTIFKDNKSDKADTKKHSGCFMQ